MKLEILAGIIAFLIGSIPFGVLVARAFGVTNLREEGSGNIGATNVSRVIGFWPAGFITLVLDAVKGMLVVLSISQGWISLEGLEVTVPLLWCLGFLSILGHCYSPWLRFRGGKGVATSYGVLLALAPWTALVGIVVFLLGFLSTKIGSVGSLLGLTMALAIHLLFYPFGTQFYLFVAIVLVVVYRHEDNLRSLVDKRERSF